MSNWLNFIGYQTVWFALVAGAARGHIVWPLVASLAFISWHIVVSTRRALDWRLMGAALGAGLVIDGGLALSGWVRYASASPALPPGGAPVWILALWISFALTLTRSLGWLMRRPAAAIALGAVGGPLAYLGAARGWQAADLAPLGRSVSGLALGWAAAMALFSYMARRALREPMPAAAPLDSSA
jgi:hypothetical protein